MAYIAEKPVRFDRSYSIGETIPDTVVDPARAPQLHAMGLIRSVVQETKASPAKDDIENASAVPEAAEDAPAEEDGGENAAAELETAKDAPAETKEKNKAAKK